MTPFSILAALAICAGPELQVVPDTENDRLVRVVAIVSADQLATIPVGKVDRAAGRKLLSFAIVTDRATLGRPMLGDYSRNGNQLTFTPRHPLAAGSLYRATLGVPESKQLTADFQTAKAKATPLTNVVEVYPTSTVLPANLLKFYIHFSQPMRNGRAIFERIHLLDEKGQRVPDPWRRTELWNADDKRFTLWIHPGRVKRGVNLREELGPVLEPQRQYTLVIERSVQDASGQSMAREYRRKFRTTAEDQTRVSPDEWKLTSARPGTRQPVTIDFGEPLDSALVLRCLEVRTSAGMVVAGSWSLERGERKAAYQPDGRWPTQTVFLHVDGILEDIAGNTPRRSFDTDLKKPTTAAPVLKVAIPVK